MNDAATSDIAESVEIVYLNIDPFGLWIISSYAQTCYSVEPDVRRVSYDLSDSTCKIGVDQPLPVWKTHA